MKKGFLAIIALLLFFKPIFSFNFVDWHNVTGISIYNPNNFNVTNYQLRLNLSNLSKYLIQTQCKDIRFIDSNGNILPYYVESCGKIFVNASYSTGTTCLALEDNISFPSPTTNYGNTSWWSDVWPSCDYCDFYAYLNLTILGSIRPIYIEIESDDGHALWVNNKLVYRNNPFGGICHVGGTAHRIYDITPYLHSGYNYIYIWCSEWEGAEVCKFRIIIPSLNLVIDKNGVYNLTPIVWVKLNLTAKSNNTIYMFYNTTANVTSNSNISTTFINSTIRILPNSPVSPISIGTYDYFNTYYPRARADYLITPDMFKEGNYYLVPYVIDKIKVPIKKTSGTNLYKATVKYMLTDISSLTQAYSSGWVFASYPKTISRPYAGTNATFVLDFPITWVNKNLLLSFIRVNSYSRYGGEAYYIITNKPTSLYYVSWGGSWPLDVSSYNARYMHVLDMYFTGLFRKVLPIEPTYTFFNISTNKTHEINITINSPVGPYYVSHRNPIIPINVSISSNYPILSCDIAIVGNNISVEYLCNVKYINVSNFPEGLYYFSVTATDLFGYSISNVTNFDLRFPKGNYSNITVYYPQLVPVKYFYINTTFTCTGDTCDYGKVELYYPNVCGVDNDTYYIPMLNTGESYNVSFRVICNYSTSYNFSIRYSIVNGFVSYKNFTMYPFFYTIYHNFVNNTLYLYVHTYGAGDNITFSIKYDIRDIFNNSIGSGSLIKEVMPDLDSVVFEYNMSPGWVANFTFYIYKPDGWKSYTPQKYEVAYLTYNPPVIYNVTVPFAYKDFYGLVCYNVSDDMAVTNVSVFINKETQWYLYNYTKYFSKNVSGCMKFNVNNLNEGYTYLLYLRAIDYTGNYTDSPVVSFKLLPPPPYNITVIYPKATQETTAIINLTVTHPLVSTINCTVSYGNKYDHITVYNATPYIFTVPLDYGINNIFFICGTSAHSTSKSITIIRDNVPPIIEDYYINDSKVYIKAKDDVGLSKAIVNMTVNGNLKTIEYNLTGKEDTFSFNLEPGNISVDAVVYDLAGLSTEFKAKYTVYGKGNVTVKVPLVATLDANLTSEGIYVKITAKTDYYPVYCTVMPFNDTMKIYSPEPYVSVFKELPHRSGIYRIYAVCVDRAGNVVTTNSVLLSVPEEFISSITARAFLNETVPAGIVALGLIILILGILMKDKTILSIGINVTATSIPVYVLLSTGNPQLTAITSMIVVITSGIIYKIFLPKIT